MASFRRKAARTAASLRMASSSAQLLYKKRFARIRSGTLLPEDFYRWSEQARQKKNQLEAGEIDVDTFLAWLANS